MKNYELMKILSGYPAGAEVKIRMLKSLDELTLYEDDEKLYEIDFPIRDLELCGDVIQFDRY